LIYNKRYEREKTGIPTEKQMGQSRVVLYREISVESSRARCTEHWMPLVDSYRARSLVVHIPSARRVSACACCPCHRRKGRPCCVNKHASSSQWESRRVSHCQINGEQGSDKKHQERRQAPTTLYSSRVKPPEVPYHCKYPLWFQFALLSSLQCPHSKRSLIF
jgi:hypothetical protein